MTGFDYVYKDEDGQKRIAAINDIRINPSYDFTLNIDGKNYVCMVDKILGEEWSIDIICCRSTMKYQAELSRLDDVYWNTDSIYFEIGDFDIASAIAQAISDVYRWYMRA